LLLAIAALGAGLVLSNLWIGLAGVIALTVGSVRLLWPMAGPLWVELIPPVWRGPVIGSVGLLIAALGGLLLAATEWPDLAGNPNATAPINWDAVGSIGEILGALGQIAIAVLAVYVAWRQYVISRDLTIQQNRITQQQTIDAYFQGISDLALDEQGFLEDWPQERAIAEGRTAAILSSVNAEGKAKIVRFLSQARLLTPLRRDRILGRPILDGSGGYQADRARGIRVISLAAMLAEADLGGTDLRRTDLSEANLVRSRLAGCNLSRANFSRTILYAADLRGADVRGTRWFYGSPETATPRSRSGQAADYQTGAGTGAVVENADFSDVQGLSEGDRAYLCAWGGPKTRTTIPGGCEGIGDRLATPSSPPPDQPPKISSD
jgi:uncharacterized protein YjbI with pentapeptide repeats